MSEYMTGLKRTHMCCGVGESEIGKEVVLMGWVNRRRDIGQLVFVVLRDRSGLIQINFDENRCDEATFKKAISLRNEFVIAVRGTVHQRLEKDFNPNMETGRIEIYADEVRILSESLVPPFQLADEGVKEDLRLRYRYIDLRRDELQYNMMMRHRAAQYARNFFSNEGFMEIETPILANSSPEGARDYLVPSRIHQGEFYALPQSPQVFKQLLMVSGMDRYFQIAKCFRDEDLRADRQPEFTQIDLEMSFVDIEDVIEVNERFLKGLFKEMLDVEVQLPIEHLTYREAMDRFGSDKPDLRFGMELVDISELVAGTEFGVFANALSAGGSVRGINAKGCGDMSRKQIDALVDYVKDFGAKGLAWIAINAEGDYKTTISKFFNQEQLDEIVKAFDGSEGDLILICADKNKVVFDALGNLRNEIARRRELVNEKEFRFVWITEFPLLEWNEEDGRFYASHHPFTAPMDEDIPLLDSDPGAVRAKAYDIVINGYEAGGGSLRIYQNDLQSRMFELLGISPERAQANFGHLLDAFKYGVPPHGGLAFGLDRLIMLLTGCTAIRDVIAFPKVKDASCPLTKAPGEVSPVQLEELGLEIVKKEESDEQ